MNFSAAYHSPIGSLHVVADEDYIHKIVFSEQPIAHLPNRLTDLATSQLAAYFEQKSKSFDLPLAFSGTNFQQEILKLVAQIPFGKTVSYTQLSKLYGDAKAIRAVAAANGKNNFAIVVPCHRVVGADGQLTGYAWGIDKKEWLLAHEGLRTPNLF